MTIVPLDPSRVLCGVLGDVHGDLPALVAAVDFVRAEAARRGLAPWVALLGDLVDRGADSAGCAAFGRVVFAIVEDHNSGGRNLAAFRDAFA